MWIRDRCYETTLVVAAFVTYVVSSILCFIGHPLVPRSADVFPNQQAYGPPKTFFTQVEPPAWVHVTLWIAVFVWQLAWLIYGILTIFRKGIKENIFCSPGVVPFETYILYLFAQILQVAWVLFLDVEILPLALLALALLALILFLCLGAACIRIANVGSILNSPDWNISRDLWLTLILVHNGLGLYAAWTAVRTLFSFGDTLHLAWGVAEATSGTVALALLITECIIWVIVDLVLLDKYTRYLLTPYIVVPFALVGSLASNVLSISSLLEANSILTIILLCLSGIFLLVKIMVLCVRHISNYKTIYGESPSSEQLAYVANAELTEGTISPRAYSVEDLASPRKVDYVESHPVDENISRETEDVGSIMKSRESQKNEPSNTPLGSMREGVIVNSTTGDAEADDVEYIYVPNVAAIDSSTVSAEGDNSLQRPLDIQQDNGRISGIFDNTIPVLSGENNNDFDDFSETVSNVETMSFHTAIEEASNDGYDTVSSNTEFEESLDYVPADITENALDESDSQNMKDIDSVSLHSQASTLTLTNIVEDDGEVDRTLRNTATDNN